MNNKRYLENVASNTCKALPSGKQRVNNYVYAKIAKDLLISHIRDARGFSSCRSRCKDATDKRNYEENCIYTCKATGDDAAYCVSWESKYRKASTNVLLSMTAE